MILNELFVKTAYDSQNTSKSKTKFKKYEAKMCDENEFGENQKIYSISAPSDTRFHYHQTQRTENALHSFPVVLKYYENQKPSEGTLDFFD